MGFNFTSLLSLIHIFVFVQSNIAPFCHQHFLVFVLFLLFFNYYLEMSNFIQITLTPISDLEICKVSQFRNFGFTQFFFK
jgi:hypothetical protein